MNTKTIEQEQPPELLPCPFCRSIASGFLQRLQPRNLYGVRCLQDNICGAEINGFDTREEAAEAWNTRATPTACLWTDEIDYWHSACGEDWCFEDGGPTENRVRFCQGCGKPVELDPAKGTE